MSATNSTPTINLPLFIGTDKPAWLTDWNGSMNTIDSAIATLQTAESGTATALASLSQSVTALSGTVEQHTTAIQTVTTATATNTGSINTITSLIGNGEPTTSDKTIIGAINEIYAEIGSGAGVDADDVNYDNTSSGLTATNVQAAIDEVQAAVDEVDDNTKYKVLVTVNGDGVKTMEQILNEIYTALAALNLSEGEISRLMLNHNNVLAKSRSTLGTAFGFEDEFVSTSGTSAQIVTYIAQTSGSQWLTATLETSGITFNDKSSSVRPDTEWYKVVMI